MLRSLVKCSSLNVTRRFYAHSTSGSSAKHGPTQHRLEGKTAVVTASTEGIGYAIAERLGRDGARVVISSRKQKNVDAALEKLKDQNLTVTGVTCHVAKATDRANLFKHAVDEHGGVDILVSNAAANPHMGSIFSVTEDQWDKIFDTNVKAAFFTCKEAADLMQARGGGCITMVSSIAGYQPFELLGPYSVSKTALLGLVKAMASDCGKMNIRVNGVAPGIIKTNFSEALWKNEKLHDQFTSGLPIKRVGQAEEVSSAVSFLVSEEASYMTGETLIISGGMPSRL